MPKQDCRSAEQLMRTVMAHPEIVKSIEDAPLETQARIEALDNLLALHSLERKGRLYGGGFLIFRPHNPGIVCWVSLTASEESWLEDVRLLSP